MGTNDKLTARAKDSGDTSRDLRFHKFVIDSLPAAVVTVDANMRISGFNPWAERLTGYREKEALGRFCGEVLRGDMCVGRCPLKAAIETLTPLSLLESTIHNRWGEAIPVRMSTAALFDEEKRLIGGVESFQDISRIKMLERERNNIISMFAHDMKSSLSIIGGFVLRLLRQGEPLPKDKQRRYLEIVKSEAIKIESLTDSFLDFSRLVAGKLKLNLTATSLDKDLIELIEAYEVKAAEKGIRIVFESREALPIIQADSRHLRRVFTNLLDNAIKFSSEKTRITVSTEETAEEVTVKVKDEGVGIRPEELPYIFDAFTRGRDTGEKAGFGLGLAAAKRIVEAHGGHIRAESQFGAGTTFYVILPKAV